MKASHPILYSFKDVFDHMYIHVYQLQLVIRLNAYYVKYKKYLYFLLRTAQTSRTYRNRKDFRLFPYLPSVCIYVILLTRSAESRTRSELRHIDDFYGKNLPGMTVNAFSNDTEWSSARIQQK